MNGGAIILCGGSSRRMGRDKATLPFGPHEVLLQRVVRLVTEVVDLEKIVCVAAAEQQLPRLPTAIQIVTDPVPHQGPLAGLATGLRHIQGAADLVFLTGCDTPLLRPEVVGQILDLIEGFELAAVYDEQRWHPLTAACRTSVLPRVESLLAAGERRLAALMEAGNTRRVSLDELRRVDPELHSLTPCNTPAEYQNVLQLAGLSSQAT